MNDVMARKRRAGSMTRKEMLARIPVVTQSPPVQTIQGVEIAQEEEQVNMERPDTQQPVLTEDVVKEEQADAQQPVPPGEPERAESPDWVII